MPIMEANLREQFYIVEGKMADRAAEVIANAISIDEIMTVETIAKHVMDLYENRVIELKETLAKHYSKKRQPDIQPDLDEAVDIVKKLNKGYIKFVYDTRLDRLKLTFAGEYAELNGTETNEMQDNVPVEEPTVTNPEDALTAPEGVNP